MSGATTRVAKRLPGMSPRTRDALPVVGIWLLASLILLIWQVRVDDWMVMTDELLYSKLATHTGETLSPVPHVHGEYYGSLNMLYPLLLAPLYAVGSGPWAFQAAHVLNAFVFASAAIPAYLLAREVVRVRWASLVVAGLCVALPWAAMTLMLLTETAAYPAFLWAILGIQRTIVAPSWRADVLALAGVGLAALGRTQFIFLAAVLPAAVVAHEALYALASARERRLAAVRDALAGTLRAHKVLAVATVVGAVGAGVILLAGSLSSLLGNYAVTAEGALLPAGWRDVAAVHLAFVAVGAGVLPFVLGIPWVLGMLVRPDGKGRHAFAVICLVTIPLLTLQVTSFTMRFTFVTQDRYLFYVVPLLVVAAAALLAGGAGVSRVPATALLVLSGLVTAALLQKAEYVPRPGPYFDSPSSAFHVVLDGQAYRFGIEASTAISIVTVLLGLALALALWRAPRPRVAGVVLGVMLAFGTYQSLYVLDKMLDSKGGRDLRYALPADDWIDRAAGDGDVALVPGLVNRLGNSYAMQTLWWSTELWNKRITDALQLGESTTFTPFPKGTLRIDPRSGLMTGQRDGDALVQSATDVRFAVRATRTVESPDRNLVLHEPAKPARALWTSDGIAEDGWTVGARPRIRLYGSGRPEARRLTMRVATRVVREPRTFTLRGGGRETAVTLQPGETAQVTLDLCVAAEGPTDVAVRTDGLTELPDGRIAGLRIRRIDALPGSGSACR